MYFNKDRDTEVSREIASLGLCLGGKMHPDIAETELDGIEGINRETLVTIDPTLGGEIIWIPEPEED